MKKTQENESILGPYRVLDLTNDGFQLCGMLLADLGADVLRVERPGGDPSRDIGPYYHDEIDREKSLYWFFYNRNKRGITLNLETEDGQAIFKRLVKDADFVIESFEPGYMAKQGLGYADMEKINPGLIMISITPFGQDGPYAEKGWKADDMIAWALGGQMWLCGDYDRPPVQCTMPHAFPHAAAEAAAAATVALVYREETGEGQHIDVSAQEAIAHCDQNAASYWELEQIMIPRGTAKMGRPGPDGKPLPFKQMYECKDGYLMGNVGGALNKPMIKSTNAISQWMTEDGLLPEPEEWYMRDITWDDLNGFEAFFKTKTKAEFYGRAVKEGMMFGPIYDPQDAYGDPQLAHCSYFVPIEHPELNDTIKTPGPFAKYSKTPMTRWFRAPLIGEHNQDIYIDELGLSTAQLESLKRAGVI